MFAAVSRRAFQHVLPRSRVSARYISGSCVGMVIVASSVGLSCAAGKDGQACDVFLAPSAVLATSAAPTSVRAAIVESKIIVFSKSACPYCVRAKVCRQMYDRLLFAVRFQASLLRKLQQSLRKTSLSVEFHKTLA